VGGGVGAAAVIMRASFRMTIVGVDPDNVDSTEADATLGDHLVGKGGYLCSRTAEQHRFQRLLMIEDNMGYSSNESVVSMLKIEKSRSKCAGAVIVNITQIGNAGAAITGTRLIVDSFPDKVAHCL
jgi:hypothetical protein